MLFAPLPVELDPRVTSSLLQKAIRRGEAEIAATAARLYHHQRGYAVWPRLLGIACEDIGIGDVACVVEAATLSLGRRVRKAREEDDVQFAAAFAAKLAKAPKERAPDYLYCAAARHPLWKEVRQNLEDGTLAAAMGAALNPNLPLVHRAIACLRVWGPQDTPGSHLPKLLLSLEEQGAPSDLLTAIEIAGWRLRHPYVVMLALAAAARTADKHPASVSIAPIPHAPDCMGVPLYAYDKHTVQGRKAIRLLVRHQHTLRQGLLRDVTPRQLVAVTMMGVFHAESALVDRKLVWSSTLKLETAGRQADMMKAGAPFKVVERLTRRVRDHLDDLDCIRTSVLTNADTAMCN